ncbi:MAG: hypothetical protein Q4A56_07225 [Porphyromonadaceae bacterium]|nr:hypothetical protein [Porphyromonadaceae bacterium]
MKRRSLKTMAMFIIAAVTGLLFACKPNAPEEPKYEYDVYVAGWYEGDKAILWKNSEPEELTDGKNESFVRSIFVAGSDVYVAGVEKNKQNKFVAKLWKNGKPKELTDGKNTASARSVFVADGNVYVAGYDGMQAILWKNSEPEELTDVKNDALANSVFVAGSDVYVAGAELKDDIIVAKLWKNSKVKDLESYQGAEAYSVFVAGSDVYVVGLVHKEGQGVAMLWKNGEPTELTDGKEDAGAFSVFVVRREVEKK